MRLLLDTNAYAELERGHAGAADMVRSAEHVYLSIIALGELLLGFRDGSSFSRNVSELDAFLDHPFVSLEHLTRATVDRFGRIATALKRAGTPIPTNDIWIAAHALELGAELVSSDRHFELVPGMVVVSPDAP